MNLNGTWQLSYGPQATGAPTTPEELASSGWPTIAAQVPGNVELDLVRAGVLPAELERGNHIYALRELESHRWWYRRYFVTPAFRDGQRVELVFEGLDCLGSIFLNGRSIGTTANMLIAHRFDVTDALRPPGQRNDLAVRIDSAVLAAGDHRGSAREYAFALNFESLPIRKAPHMFGWDMMPRVVSAGLWRDVSLQLVDATRFDGVYFATLAVDAEARTARVLLTWELRTDRLSLDDLRLHATLSDEAGAVLDVTNPAVGARGRMVHELRDVKLWWPRGYGEAHLYQLRLQLLAAVDRVLAAEQFTVGLRTAELRYSPTTTPKGDGAFEFRVNGERIFIRGTNWVPLDALHSRDPRHLDTALDMAADLNCNMIRCWGGNVYEDHPFFDLCDRHGLLVWQDFALACAVYPQDDAFAAQLAAEAEYVVRKLRRHASLALWCGGNETDDAANWSGLPIDPNADRPTRQVLAEAVQRHDPARTYLPNSPYHSPAFVAARPLGHETQPEQHLWGPRLDFKSHYYTGSTAHFVSEIGYHGCPAKASLEQMLDPQSLWPWQDNDQWLTHCVRPVPTVHDCDYRVPLMARQIAHLFGTVPDALDDYVFASQASQAEALKFFIEFFRIGKWRRTGIIWWNLRDGWPILSDAVVDYYNRKKAAYHYIKRVQADVCAIMAEPAAGAHHVVVVNDTRQAQTGSVQIRDVDAATQAFEFTFQVEPNSRAVAGSIPSTGSQKMWSIDWRWSGDHRGSNHYLAGTPPFSLSRYRQWIELLRGRGKM